MRGLNECETVLRTVVAADVKKYVCSGQLCEVDQGIGNVL